MQHPESPTMSELAMLPAVPASLPGPPPALRLRDVDVERGRSLVLRDIDLDVPQGGITGLIGINGAGKTSLIKAILGLAGIARGHVEIFGEPASARSMRDAIAYLPEQFRPAAALRGAAYVRLMRGFDSGRDGGRSGDALAIAAALDLDPAALARPIRTFSKGMAQKLGLAVTLAGPARLLVLDEPMSGLDPRARALLKTCLIRARAQGRSLLLCSHILADLDELADHVAIVHGGRLLAAGPLDSIRGRHATLERAFLATIGDGGVLPDPRAG